MRHGKTITRWIRPWAKTLLVAGAATAGLLAGAGAMLIAKPGAIEGEAYPIKIAAEPIERLCARPETTGRLAFRGGLRLFANDRNFGGLSGLSLDPDGAGFVAVTDAGAWITGNLVEEDGRLSAIENARIGPILDRAGKPLRQGKRGGDAESLARHGDEMLIGFEGTNTIAAYPIARDGLSARARAIRVPDAVRQLPRNRGLEALAVAPAASPVAGAIVAIAERSKKGADTTAGFIIGGARGGSFAVQRHDDFDVTDLAFLPDGDLVILERFYSGFTELRMRLRRIAAGDLVAGAVLDGMVLADIGLDCRIDNMEALAVHQNAEGETILTLMSDDNFSILQSTIVLRFALTP